MIDEIYFELFKVTAAGVVAANLLQGIIFSPIKRVGTEVNKEGMGIESKFQMIYLGNDISKLSFHLNCRIIKRLQI